MVFKNNASLINGEIPTDHGFLAITPFFPGYDFSGQSPFTWNAPG
jgi:hypothetical protein